MVKPLKFTKTVTTGVLIASFVTSGLPTTAFAAQANAYADEFQAFVESVERNKTDDAVANQGANQTVPAEQTSPAPQTDAPPASEVTAPQNEPAVPVEGVQADSSSAGATEADAASDAVKKDEVALDKVAIGENEAPADLADGAEATEPVDSSVSVATAENPGKVLGKFKDLFPTESFRNIMRSQSIIDWADDRDVTLEMLQGITNFIIYYNAGPFTIGAKDAESLGYMTNLDKLCFYGNQMGENSWNVEDMGKLWASIGKMTKLTFLTVSNPNIADNGNLTLDIPRLPNLKSLQICGLTQSIFDGGKVSQKVYDGSALNANNLPKLTSLDMDGTHISNWGSLAGLNSLVRLSLSHDRVEDAGFISGMTKLKELNIYGNSISDFGPIGSHKGISGDAYQMAGQRIYKVGDSAITIMGNESSRELPLVFKLPNGDPMPQSAMSIIQPKGGHGVSSRDGALPQGVTYNAQTGQFSITRDAANKLPEYTVAGKTGKMLAVQFNSTVEGTDVSGKAYIEVKVSNEIPNNPPVINGAVDKTINQGTAFDPLAGVTATDQDKGDKATLTHAGEVKVNEPGKYQVTYTATDSKGLKTIKTITVTVNGIPTISGVAATKTIVQGDSFDPKQGVTANDHEQGVITGDIQVSGAYDVNKPGTYTITFTVTDNNGAKATATMKLTVKANQAPVINASNLTIVEGDKFEAAKHATATDAEDGTLPVTVVSNNVNPNKYGEYHVTYSATDKKGLKTEKTITVTVNPRQMDLNGSPVFEGLSDKTIMLGDEFDPKAGVTATDPEEGVLQFTVSGKVDNTKVGTYELVFTAKDSKGAMVTKTIAVTVKQPLGSLNQAPTINASDVTIVQGESFDPMAGVSASDPEDGELTVKLESGTVDTAKPGEYVLVYSAIDSEGAKVTKTITVKVIAKQVVPGKPARPAKPGAQAQLPQTGDASMAMAGASGIMGALALAAERLRRRRK